jgi:HPr kinase/phosphorylase
LSNIEDQISTGVTIDELVNDHHQRLMLEFVAGREGGWRHIQSSETHRPSLALTGFVDLYAFDRAQLLGNTELLYLSNLDKDERRQSLEIIYQFDLPCIIITNNYDIPEEITELSDAKQTPLLRTPLSSAQFIHQFVSCIEEHNAPTTAVHGTMVDVYGVGLLITGRSGIGKSEVALDLIERGHRLVGDDVVQVKRRRDIIVGQASPLLHHNMEIRGIGIINVESLFGVRAIRSMKRIEVEVRLVEWDSEGDYERLGLDEDRSCVLGIEIPLVRLPIYPGKNITVISETIAMTYLLKLQGYSAAAELNTRISEALEGDKDDQLGDPDAT